MNNSTAPACCSLLRSFALVILEDKVPDKTAAEDVGAVKIPQKPYAAALSTYKTTICMVEGARKVLPSCELDDRFLGGMAIHITGTLVTLPKVSGHQN